MKSFRRALLALDLAADGSGLTSGSRLAMQHALELAPGLDSELVLFHSSAPDEAWDAGSGEFVEVPDGLRARDREVLEESLERLRSAGLRAELVISKEPAALGIVRRVLRDGIDLVWCGKRNEPEPFGLRLGSVSTKLLRMCPCAVWVVKPDATVPPVRILAATDLTAVGDRVLETAADLAERGEAELHVVHAFQRPLAVQMEGDASTSRYEETKRRECSDRIRSHLAECGSEREAHLHVGLTSPTRAILACEERLDPDLIVMGTISRGGVAGWLLGNTAERLLPRLDTSLLTLKPDNFVCPVEAEAE